MGFKKGGDTVLLRQRIGQCEWFGGPSFCVFKAESVSVTECLLAGRVQSSGSRTSCCALAVSCLQSLIYCLLTCNVNVFSFEVELAMIMDRLYGGVCYAGIDTDPELKYPKGAGRVAFSNQQSYIAAISARFVQLQHGDIDKRVSDTPEVICA